MSLYPRTRWNDYPTNPELHEILSKDIALRPLFIFRNVIEGPLKAHDFSPMIGYQTPAQDFSKVFYAWSEQYFQLCASVLQAREIRDSIVMEVIVQSPNIDRCACTPGRYGERREEVSGERRQLHWRMQSADTWKLLQDGLNSGSVQDEYSSQQELQMPLMHFDQIGRVQSGHHKSAIGVMPEETLSYQNERRFSNRRLA